MPRKKPSGLTFTCSECKQTIAAEEVMDHNCMIAKPMVVPDAIGEVFGWRAWIVHGEGNEVRLGSVTHSKYRWPPKTFMLAECPMHGIEDIPAQNHSCGLYAAKTREHLLSMTYHRYDEVENVIIGEVAMSGRVIPGTQGWRAQRGRVHKLYVPYEKWRLVNPLKEVYGVDVELSNTLALSEEVQKKSR